MKNEMLINFDLQMESFILPFPLDFIYIYIEA